MFFEPHVNEITVGSIIRIDTKHLDQVEELMAFEYDIVDSFENTYYIMPTLKKEVQKPKSKLEYHTSGGDMEFDYLTEKWFRSRKERTRYLVVTCHKSQLQKVLDLTSELDLDGCPDYSYLEDDMIEYSESFNEYDSDNYKEFKKALKNI